MTESDGQVQIRSLVRRFIDFRPPRFPSLFEAIVNAIACQQLSLTVGIILLNRLARTFGHVSFAGQLRLRFLCRSGSRRFTLNN